MTAGDTARQRIDDWLDRLSAETDQAAHSAIFQGYLKATSRFYKYSSANVILILSQRPDATRVGGRTTLWEPLGYKVRKGEWRNGIQILRPRTKVIEDEETGEKREIIIDWAVCWIYDIAQVDPTPTAQPLDLPWATSPDDHDGLYRLLLRVCTRLKITVDTSATLPLGVQGYSTGTGQIVLNSNMDRGNRVAVLAHEIAHETQHTTVLRRLFSKEELECQAEATAYVVLSALGIDSPNSGQYLALYRVNADTIRRNAQAIHTATKHILKEMELAEAFPPLAAREGVVGASRR